MRVLNAILVREFYLANSSFFLLVIAIAGGFMRSYEHIALAEFFISTPMVLIIPVAIWSVYSLKVINFNRERIALSENEFVFCFILLSETKQWSMTLRVAALQLLPVFLYGAFLCLVASKHGLAIPIIVIVISSGILLWTTAFHLLLGLRYPNHEKKISPISRLLNTRLTKPISLFFIEWTIRNDLAMFVGTKVFTILTLTGITELYKTDSYDLRLLSLGIVIGSSANASLMQTFHHFENFHMNWLKGLPLSFLKRMSSNLLTIIIMVMPEALVLIKNFPQELSWLECGAATIFLLSIPILFYGGSYIKDRNQQEIMPIVFCFVLGWFVAILFKIPILLLAAINISIGIYLWKKFYYSFEYISKE